MTGGLGSMPGLVSPMLPAAGTGQPPVGPDWVVELAWTGHRCVAYVEPGRRTRLLSSGGVSMTPAYPELGPELERRSPPRGMILDGTLVARGEEHAPRAARLQRRSARFRPSDRHIDAVPVDLQVADLLWFDGHSLVDMPYRDRRALLTGLGFAAAPVWTTSPLPVSELPSLLAVAEAKGVEALHARHLGARYHPGQRSPLWVRVPVPRIGRVLVGGWTPVDAARPDRIASLLVGVPEADGLRYVGRVGVSGDERRPLPGLLQLRCAESPFRDALPPAAARDAIWVEPRVVGLVDHTGFTADARLRLPHWRGLAGAGTSTVPWARRDDPAPPDRSVAVRGPSPDPAPRPPVDATRPSVDPVPHLGRSTASPAAPPPAPPRTVEVPDPRSALDPGRPVSAAPPREFPETPFSSRAGSGSSPGPASAPADVHSVVHPAARDAGPGQARRLEQHFVYNSLNAIASLIRTDPARARELLVGFADLSRATDRPTDAPSTLGHELSVVRDYLALEQARFGKRLRVEISIDPALHATPVEPLRLLAAVRETVQHDIEPRARGGLLTIAAEPADGGCRVTVSGAESPPKLLVLAAPATV